MSETAIVLEVPEAEAVAGRFHRCYTRAGADRMPVHMTLLIPFVDSESLSAEVVAQARAALESEPPFDFALTESRRFDSEPETVLWLAPEPYEPFVLLTGALVREFPEHRPYGGVFDDIVPHLTVAVSADHDLLDRIEGELAGALPIRARAARAGIYEHSGAGWRLHSPLRLRS